jgi:hypothetical protein
MQKRENVTWRVKKKEYFDGIIKIICTFAERNGKIHGHEKDR